MSASRSVATLIGPALAAFLGAWQEPEATPGSRASQQARPADRDMTRDRAEAVSSVDP
jgi:hypothetical protein